MKPPKEQSRVDRIAITMRSLIMILVSRGFISAPSGDTLMDFLKADDEKKKPPKVKS